MSLFRACLALVAVLAAACGSPDEPPTAGPVVTVYTDLPAASQPDIEGAYRAATGRDVRVIAVNTVDLAGAIAGDEDAPPADVLFVSGVGALAALLDTDSLRPVPLTDSGAVESDPDGYWHAIGYVYDVIVTSGGATPGAYADLAGDDYRGRLCLRPGDSPRSIALVAWLIESLGERDAELVVRGWRFNLAGPVNETERDALEAVARGDCAVTVAASDTAQAFVSAGADVSIVVADDAFADPLALGVARHAKNADAARDFLAWALGAGRDALVPPAAVSETSGPASSTLAFRYEDALLLMERARYR